MNSLSCKLKEDYTLISRTSLIDRAAKDFAGRPLTITGFRDQFDRKWVRFEAENLLSYKPLLDLAFAGTKAFSDLDSGGICIAGDTQRFRASRLATKTCFKRRALVIEYSGWFGSRYIWPETVLPLEIDGREVIDLRKAQPWLTSGGSPIAFREEVARLVRGQDIPTFALCCGLASLLLAQLPNAFGNPAFEIRGGSDRQRSTLMQLAGSVLGRGDQQHIRWRKAVREAWFTMAARQDGLLLLDHSAAFLTQNPILGIEESQDFLEYFIAGNVVSQGESASTEWRQRCVLLSNSDEPPSSEVLSLRRSKRRSAVVQASLIKVNADAGCGLGPFQTLPARSRSCRDALKDLRWLTETHFGWLGRAFGTKLEAQLAREHGKLRLQRRIGSEIRAFLAHLPMVTQAERPMAEKFAIVASAGNLAARWGLIPFGGIERSVLAVCGKSIRPE